MDEREHIDLLIGSAEETWEEVPEVEASISQWPSDRRITYLETWPLEEDVLEQLAEYAETGAMSPEQIGRWVAVRQLVTRNRPLVERLFARLRGTRPPLAAIGGTQIESPAKAEGF